MYTLLPFHHVVPSSNTGSLKNTWTKYKRDTIFPSIFLVLHQYSKLFQLLAGIILAMESYP